MSRFNDIVLKVLKEYSPKYTSKANRELINKQLQDLGYEGGDVNQEWETEDLNKEIFQALRFSKNGNTISILVPEDPNEGFEDYKEIAKLNYNDNTVQLGYATTDMISLIADMLGVNSWELHTKAMGNEKGSPIKLDNMQKFAISQNKIVNPDDVIINWM